jgi:hypothetical protein
VPGQALVELDRWRNGVYRTRWQVPESGSSGAIRSERAEAGRSPSEIQSNRARRRRSSRASGVAATSTATPLRQSRAHGVQLPVMDEQICPPILSDTVVLFDVNSTPTNQSPPYCKFSTM